MITELISNGRLWLWFLGLAIGGESVLLPGIYLGMSGEFDLRILFALSLAATTLSDFTLYLVGCLLPWERVESSRFVQRRVAVFRVALDAFIRNRTRYLFLSRFVYGTRSVAQILCGATHLNFGRYATVNLCGAAIWLALVMGIVLTTDKSLELVRAEWFRVQLAFGLLILFLILFQLWIRKRIRQHASLQSFRHTTKRPRSVM